jgi:site-specific DNA recombinase
MMQCECGNAVAAEIKKGKYDYYHCTAYGVTHKKAYVLESVVNGQYAQIVGKATIPAEWYEFLRTSLEQEMKGHKIRLARERELLESAREKILTNTIKAFQAHLDGTVSEDFFKKVQEDYQRELDAFNERLSSLGPSIAKDFDVAMMCIELSHQAESLFTLARMLIKSDV